MKEGKVERGREEPQSAEGDGCSDDRPRSGALDDDNDTSNDRAKDGCEDREQAGDSYTKSD